MRQKTRRLIGQLLQALRPRAARIAIVVWFVPLVIAGCASPQVIPPNQVFEFRSAEERKNTEYRALHGDAEAAKRMAEYELYLTGDRLKGIYWTRIAAHYGDKVAKENLKTLEELERQR